MYSMFNLSRGKTGQNTFFAQSNGSDIPSNIRISVSTSRGGLLDILDGYFIIDAVHNEFWKKSSVCVLRKFPHF